ncbi:Transmembrane domain-containing protein [Spironucleus salmonicida]|uniref:Transmembrane domain-containing protein n=1 Tax=Spironucleus salmonicida TaxID=348837 RepID=V6LUG6_9EUKA|nr:Transmembrane domain-containing protein [Spironucleus salmonicida]KAH0571697.1 Transmembrane domain-containing protein [Spironucleus salmonicida]|eukprot:EST48210.1 Transmembrane domain-containing protein [Spironucleus salmonicida]
MIGWKADRHRAPWPSKADRFFYSGDFKWSTRYLTTGIVVLAISAALLAVYAKRIPFAKSIPVIYALSLLLQYFGNVICLLDALHLHQSCLVHSSKRQEARSLIVIGVLINWQFLMVITRKAFFAQKLGLLRFDRSDVLLTLSNCLPQAYLLFSVRQYEVFARYGKCASNAALASYLAVAVVVYRGFLTICRMLVGDRVAGGSGNAVQVEYAGAAALEKEFRC